MSLILLITSSPRGSDGLSTRFASDLARRLELQRPGSRLTIRDLSELSLPHIDEAYIVGRETPSDARTSAQVQAVRLAETLIAELKAADIIVIGSAMINFGPSTQLRAWFDHVIWPGVTFDHGDNTVEGLVKVKKAYLVTASAGVYSEGPLAPMDFQSAYLKHLLGFIGITDVQQLYVEGTGTSYGPDAAKVAIEKANTALESMLAGTV